MPRVNRAEICADDEVQVFHPVNRCVRRTFLFGECHQTGKDYSHRKQNKTVPSTRKQEIKRDAEDALQRARRAESVAGRAKSDARRALSKVR